MLVLLPAAMFMEHSRRGDAMRAGHVKSVPVVGLFGCGVLIFADDQVIAGAAAVATIVLLFVIGFVEGHWRAVWWAAVVLLSALTADILWQVGWDPFDRSDDYESIPQSPFVLVGLPLPIAVVAAGVGSRLMWRRHKQA